ncbi:hypothetical protein [Sorangium sp. So ce341]|uniref:hypothetical protein n=1 Tax=Sorangium sp. So ce341 TaxID=3133302 RepID=UPI003F5D6C34
MILPTCMSRPLRLSRALALALAVLATWLCAPRRACARPPPRLFLSCSDDCFDPYLRQQLSYFDFVRDVYLADIALVIVRRPAGTGGEQWTATLARRTSGRAFESRPPASVLSPPGAPAHAERDRLLQLILRLLVAELAGTPHGEAFKIGLPQRENLELSSLDDPWNYWVFAPAAWGSAEAGSGYYRLQAGGGAAVRRITEHSKVRLMGGYTRSLSSYRLEDGDRIFGDVYEWDGRALYAHSIGSHFALGGIFTAIGNEFENYRWHMHGGPVIEANLFPYQQNATRQLRFIYQVGAWASGYVEDNEAGLRYEQRPYHALSMIIDLNHAWGSVEWIGQVNEFLDDPELYRMSTGLTLSVRVFEGLTASIEGQFAWVRDLINLRGRTITDDELLLETAQQPTDFTSTASLSITYTFGSAHNTVVNPRFGRIDLEDE